MTISDYISEVSERWKPGIATEHSYRPVLQALFESFAPGCRVTNEPRRQACGAPDFIVDRRGISVGKDADAHMSKTA